ncbi:carbohydrate-binding domain-containing protein [Lachnospiraceae bacterium LCP25S3_G4]
MKKKLLMVLMVLCMLGVGCSNTSDTKQTNSDEDGTHATSNTVTLTEGNYSKAELDASWQASSATQITCNQNSIDVAGSGVSVDGQKISITAAGTYVLAGTLTDGQVIVDVANKGDVKLVFNAITISSTTSAPIYIKEAGNVVVTLSEGTINQVEDAAEYTLEDTSVEEPNACIFSKDDLTFNGTGSLEVIGNYNNGIQCKDDLTFISGVYTITAADDGIVGKDSIQIKDGIFQVQASSDGMKTTNAKESDKGYIIIDGGTFDIEAGNDGVQAEKLLYVNDGDFQIKSGTGSANATNVSDAGGEVPMNGGKTTDGQTPNNLEKPVDGGAPTDMQKPADGEVPADMPQQTDGERLGDRQKPSDQAQENESTKGLKSYVDIVVCGGSFTIDSEDDTIHSNQDVTITNGTYQLSAGDDGIHGDNHVTIENGDFNIVTCYEGIEGTNIKLNGGTITMTARDDGMNSVNEDDGSTLEINGGNIYIKASGDGLDSNGSITINDGTVTVQGPTNGGNGTFDYNGTMEVNGGVLFGAGSIGMAQSPSKESKQSFVVGALTSMAEAGTVVTVEDKSGNEVCSYTVDVQSQWLCISNPIWKEGETYTLNIGDLKTSVTITGIENKFE